MDSARSVLTAYARFWRGSRRPSLRTMCATAHFARPMSASSLLPERGIAGRGRESTGNARSGARCSKTEGCDENNAFTADIAPVPTGLQLEVDLVLGAAHADHGAQPIGL